jgi:rSAM/selenodomain-associated transferase 2
MRLSIIVPMLNEEAGIEATLIALRELPAEIIAVDGGSRDNSCVLAAPHAHQLLQAARGRARQMNAGAAVASGDMLLFLHADTCLPAAADQLIEQAMIGGADWGRFDVQIAGQSCWFPLIAGMMNWRSRLTGIATGDQAIFVKRRVFEQIGGFPDLPLMEDIVLSRRLKQQGRPACLRQKVRTAGRRWEKHGVLRTILTMWWLRLRFFFGAEPGQLAQHFRPLHGGADEGDGVVSSVPRSPPTP